MRIEHLTFERYGLFTDRTLSFRPDATIHVVLGANEAGKTSALSGIGDLLFGFGGRTGYDFKHDNKALRIGGRFRHSDGSTVTARRRKGNKNTLVDANDQPLADDTLTPLLNGLTRDAFYREFGLTAAALREGGHELLNAGGRLAETLAASSAGMTALSRLKDRLQSEADELFTPRRAGSRAFYVAADRRESADKTLREATVTREALRQLDAEVASALARRQALNEAHAQSGRTLARLQRTQRVRSHLLQLDRIAANLAQLGPLPDVTAAVLADWRAASAAAAGLDRDIARLDADAAADAAEIAGLAIDDALLAEKPAIDGLRERLGAVRKAIGDAPQVRQARDDARAKLDEFAQRLGLPDSSELLARLPTDPAIAQARDLIERIRTSEQTVADAATRHSRARQELSAFADDDGAHAVVDVTQLRQRLDALGDVPAQADRLRREAAAFARDAALLRDTLAALDPPPGPVEALRALPLPEREAIAEHCQVADVCAAEIKRLSGTIAAFDETIAATEAELSRLSVAGAVPTRHDLATARRIRDGHVERLRAALDGERADRAARFADVASATQTIDSLTDYLLADTERAARYGDAQSRLIADRAGRDNAAATLARLNAESARLDQRWQRIWLASHMTPHSPTEMLRWRDRIDDALKGWSRLDQQNAEIAALTSALEAGRVGTLALLAQLGRSADDGLAADILFREAKARIDALQMQWADAKARAAEKRRIERDLTEAEAARQAGESALALVQQEWPAAMAAIGLPPNATPAQATAALTVWRDVPLQKAAFEREGRSAAALEADLQAFAHDVSDIVARAAPDLGTHIAQDALANLADRLADNLRASEASRRLQTGAARRAAERETLVGRRSALTSTLDDACRAFGAAPSGEHGLVEVDVRLDVLAARHRLESERAELRRALQDIGDGLDEDTLRQERVGLDPDDLSSEIARLDVEQNQLKTEMEDALTVHHQKTVERDTLMRGRDAAAAAIERTEAGAELLSVAEGWLLRSAAVRLATRAIERHRAMVQDPLIDRAGALFALATADAFSGLGVDYGQDDQPELVARRGDGERVPISGLSEGTRDQLFLALRIALLERRTSEPTPFIGDDILASFDETRALATLRLLAAAGAHRQVILFTHHRHVAELAQGIEGNAVDLIAL